MTISPYFLTALRVRRILFLLLFGLWAGNGLAQSPHINYVSLLGAGPGTAVQIHGSGFTGVTAVHFGNVNAQSFTINQDTMINAIVGNGASGYISVWASGGVDSLAGFTFFPAATGPAIRTFTPGSGGPGTVVTIYGLRFTGATAVRFGGTAAASFTVVSDTVISATVGYGNTGFVSVSTPSGTSGNNGFIYLPPPGPTHISFFSPAIARPGTTVAIHGVSFTGVSAVRFGGVAAQSFAVAADTLIDAVVGSGASGQVWVSGTQGLDSLAGFVYEDTSTAPPIHTLMHSFAPASGTTGTMVMIHGAGLSTVNVVRFGGVPAQTFTIVNDTLTGAVVGNGASGQVFIAGPHGLDSLPGFRFVDTTKKVFQLVTLTAAANGMHPEVQWLSLHDQGIAYYEVEHAPDSFHFSPVGAVASHHKDTASYIFTDSVARTGMNFYRLKIVDTAGRVDSSFIVAIAMPTSSPTLTGFPNPAAGALYVPLPASPNTSKMTVSDMNGRVMMTVIVPPNTTSMQLDLSRLLKGVYKVIWSDGTNSRYQTVLVWK